MTGSDDGGFTPHPGDPWHPGWSDDAEPDDTAAAVDSGSVDSVETSRPPERPEQPEQPKKPKKPKKSKRRRRKDAISDEDEPDPAFDPTTTAFDSEPEGMRSDQEAEDGDDPFGAVLEREGRTARRPDAGDAAPPPAWTVDQAPSSEQALPMEQPSWVGQTTGAAPGVEAVGFDPAVKEEAIGDDTAQVLSVGEEIGSDVPVEPAVSAADGVGVPPAPAEPIESDGVQEELVGTYGVAGPEAFDVLDEDDASTGELEDWDDFMAGAASLGHVPASADEVIGEPEPVEAAAVVAEPVDTPTKKRRGLFRRHKAGPVDEVFDQESPVDYDSETWDEPEESPAAPSAFSPPTEELGDADAFGDWVDSTQTEHRRFFRRRKRRDDPPPPEEDAEEFVGGAVPVWDDVEALAEEAAAKVSGRADRLDEHALMADDGMVEDIAAVIGEPAGVVDSFDQAGPEGEPAGVDEAQDDADAVAEAPAFAEPIDQIGDLVVPSGQGPVDAPTETGGEVQPALFEDGSEVGVGTVDPTDVGAGEDIAFADEERAGRQTADPDLDQPLEWEDDGTRLPSDWFAQVDEDEAVPPPVAETPETEWLEPEAEVHTADPMATEVFDIDDPEPVAPVPQHTHAGEPSVPDGYEPWSEAVEGAVAAAGAQTSDETFEYETPVAQEPERPSEELPTGFERFPSELERFELPEEELRAEMAPNDFGGGWVTDDVYVADTSDSQDDLPFGGTGESTFDEEIYAAGGTIEHRDLAAAIAEAGEENTQWQAISAAMPGLETGVVGFDDVADLGTGGDYVAPTRSNLSVRVATGLVLVGLLFGSLFLADVAFAVFIGLMLMLGLVEFYGALRRAGYLPLSLFGLIGGAGTLVAVWFHGPLAVPAGVLITSVVTFFFYAFSPTRRDALANGGLTVLGIGWIVATVSFALPIARTEDRVVLVFAIVAVTAATDIGAFSFGRSWGRSPLAPVLSPNKTIEGLAGGVLLGLAAAGAIGFFELGPFDLKSALALGALVAVLAPLGDLAESLVKRSLGVKDMGGALPGHGGVLDRIDAFLFVIPAAWVLFESIGLLG